MRPSKVFILSALFALIQVTLLDYFKLFGVKPDLLLIAVFLGCLFLDFKRAMFLAISTGFFKDIFSFRFFGFNTVLFALWVLLLNHLMRRVSIEDNLSRTVVIFTVALLSNVIAGLALLYLGAHLPVGGFLRIVIISPIYTVLIFSLIIKYFVK
ncbi:MAG: rod shape-determining protein MreD [Candidatus Omnitrophica bacterium]|nr:rod shape-determining protein MreD [Candidatus Omnitrophota bacterium]